jgi:hypothetical protein
MPELYSDAAAKENGIGRKRYRYARLSVCNALVGCEVDRRPTTTRTESKQAYRTFSQVAIPPDRAYHDPHDGGLQ